MATKCYAQVRGSALRVTGLGTCGQMLDPIPYAVSKSVVKVTINEVAESLSNEVLRTEDEEARLHFATPGQTIRHTVDIDFLRVDPGLLSLITGVRTVRGYLGTGYGFGEGPFGETPFGEGPFGTEPQDVVGFDAQTRRPSSVFALEVWSRLAGNRCADGTEQWGYTLFPYLKGGYLSGFSFDKGLVSFNLRGAQTRRGARWGVGPYDIEGTHERFVEVVGRTSSFKNMIIPLPPPTEMDGIQQTEDVIEGGDASFTTADVVDGEFVETSPWIIEGGRAL